MRIQLDTTNKTIKVEEKVNLSELIALLDKILPNKEWEKFALETNVTINNWQSPIIIDRYVERYHGPYWYNNNGIYLCANGTTELNSSSDLNSQVTCSADSGIYNLESKSNANLG